LEAPIPPVPLKTQAQERISEGDVQAKVNDLPPGKVAEGGLSNANVKNEELAGTGEEEEEDETQTPESARSTVSRKCQ
jgi:hypothetical protein